MGKASLLMGVLLFLWLGVPAFGAPASCPPQAESCLSVVAPCVLGCELSHAGVVAHRPVLRAAAAPLRIVGRVFRGIRTVRHNAIERRQHRRARWR